MSDIRTKAEQLRAKVYELQDADGLTVEEDGELIIAVVDWLLDPDSDLESLLRNQDLVK
ncbi:hypothetical protein OV320_7799 [Actinobacteria bacterium OV320]|nr:hypothetical protein OV320_7799 [Actinobacteria bacterium OV320]